MFKIDRVFYTRLWTRFLMIFLSFILSLSFLWVYLIKTYSPYKDATLFSFILRKEVSDMNSFLIIVTPMAVHRENRSFLARFCKLLCLYTSGMHGVFVLCIVDEPQPRFY